MPLYKTNKGFRTLQIFTAAIQSFTHGTNDAQKAMGIITMALIASGLQTSDDVQGWGVTVSLLWAWVLTIPVSATLAGLVFTLIHLLFF